MKNTNKKKSQKKPEPVKIYASFDDQGYPTGFYRTDIHKTIPKAATEITVNQYTEFVENSGKRILVGKKVVTATIKTRLMEKEELILRIKSEAAIRIAASGHDWMALRQVTTNKPVPEKVLQYAKAVRAASDALEKTLPQDYADDKHWPERI